MEKHLIEHKARKHTSPIIQEALKNIDPTRREMVRRRMLIAARIDDALKAKTGHKNN